MPATRIVNELGPWKRSVTKVRLRKPTKAEARREVLIEAIKAGGGVRTVAALGIGAGGAAAVREKAERSKEAAARRVAMHISPRMQEPMVAKSDERSLVDIAKDGLNNPKIDPNARFANVDVTSARGKRMRAKARGSVGEHEAVAVVRRAVPVMHLKKADEDVEPDLAEIAKAFGILGDLGSRYATAMGRGLSHGGGVQGAREAARKVYQRTGGLAGVQGAVANPYAKAGLGALAGGAALLGGRKLAQKGAAAATENLIAPAKRKALKYAGYGAAGLGGTVALGTAAGNMASNRR